MPQTGYTPILLYGSTTATNVPLAANLTTNSSGVELAINAADGKLYYKDSGGVVQVLATKAGAFGTVTSVAATVPAFLSVSGSPITSSGTLAISLSGTALPVANGGTGLTSYTANGVVYASASGTLATGSALTFDGTTLTGTVSGALAANFNRTTSSGPTLKIQVVGTDVGTLGSDTGGNGIFDIAGGNINLRATGTSSVIAFSANNAEQMRLTSTGLGIGTSSPGQKLDVRGNVMAGNGTIQTVLSYDTMGAVGTFSNHGLHILTNSTVVGTFDTSGNLGLGVTPSAWDTNSRAIQLRNSGGLYDLSFGGVSTYTFLSNNSYRSSGGTDRYLNSYAASNYLQNNGSHIWNNAPSGTAGNAITFTQAMTLDASGSLLVGRTARLNTEKFSVLQAAGSDGIALTDATNYTSFWSITSAGAALNSNGALIFGTGSSYTERARIDSSGNLLVGTTTKAGNGNTFYSGTSGQQAISIWNGATSGNNYFLEFGTEGTYTARGSITYNRGAGLVAYNVASDYRAKDVYGPVVDSGAVIDSTPVYMGKMKGATQERPMFIAHETPAYAHTGEKDAVDADGNPVFQQMDASALVPVMWAEIQSLRARLKAANIA